MRAILYAIAALALIASCAFAQAGENATLPLPPNPPPPGTGIPDFNGVWQLPYTPNLERPYGGPLPFTALGAEKYKAHLGGDDPHGFCQPTGPTRAFHSPFPFQIVQSSGMLTVLFEIDHTFRRIFTDGRSHPKDQDTNWYGDSIGRYEGNSLYADTTGISDRSWLDTAGHQHSDQLHVVERLRRTGPDAIAYEYTVDDPVMYAKPWKQERMLTPLKPTAGLPELLEYLCNENNKDVQHLISTRPR